MDKFNPFWVVHPTFKHISKLLFETQYPHWLWNTMYVAVGATALSIFASVLPPMPSCGCGSRAPTRSAC